MDSESQIEFMRLHTSQQQQIIDVLMMILKNSNANDAAFVDWIHNDQGKFLSEMTEAELIQLTSKWEAEKAQ